MVKCVKCRIGHLSKVKTSNGVIYKCSYCTEFLSETEYLKLQILEGE